MDGLLGIIANNDQLVDKVTTPKGREVEVCTTGSGGFLVTPETCIFWGKGHSCVMATYDSMDIAIAAHPGIVSDTEFIDGVIDDREGQEGA